MKRTFRFSLKAGLVDNFRCLNGMIQQLVSPRGCFYPFIATPSRFRPHTQAGDDATVALNS